VAGSVKAKKCGKTAALTPDEAARVSALMRDARVEPVAIDAVRPDARNARRHPPKQVGVLAENIRQFGFTNPILVDEDGEILAGHARYAAARLLGLGEIPIIRRAHLTPAEKRALALADNRIAELGSWDPNQLKETLNLLVEPSLELSFDLGITGFDSKEIDSILHPVAPRRLNPLDQLPDVKAGDQPVVTRLGDQWDCGDHVLVCGDPFELEFAELSAVVAIVDPLPSMVQGDLDETARHMLACSHKLAAQVRPGAMIYWFIDWWQIIGHRHPEGSDCLGPTRCSARGTRALPIAIRAGRSLCGRGWPAPLFSGAAWAQSAASHQRLDPLGRRSDRASAQRPQARQARDRHSQGLLRTGRSRARSVCGLRHHHDRGPAHRPPRVPHGARSALVRCHHSALGGVHQGSGASRGIVGDLCGCRQAALERRNAGELNMVGVIARDLRHLRAYGAPLMLPPPMSRLRPSGPVRGQTDPLLGRHQIVRTSRQGLGQ
jgi:hypothetical protein